jgi:hypothetical protein
MLGVKLSVCQVRPSNTGSAEGILEKLLHVLIHALPDLSAVVVAERIPSAHALKDHAPNVLAVPVRIRRRVNVGLACLFTGERRGHVALIVSGSS